MNSTPAPASPLILPTHLRLLSCNILAGGRVGRYRDYVTRSWSHVMPHSGKQTNLDGLAKIMADFDLVGLQEADGGSFRSGFLNQTRYLAEEAGFPYWSHQPNRNVSRLAQSANGLISRLEPTEVIDYPLPGRIPGRGALFARFGRGPDSLAVIVAHLSLGAAARAHQLGFIGELLEDERHAVLMGDLNCSVDSAELGGLLARTTLRAPDQPAPTFPSWRPRRAIDHILVSPDIEIEQIWTLPQAFSDHLSLAASVRMPPAANAA